MFISRKILGKLSHHVILIEGCLRLQKNLGSMPVNHKNTTLYPFWRWGGCLLMFYMGKHWKTSKIACYRDLNPLNGVIVLIVYPIPWDTRLETFSDKFGTFKFSPLEGATENTWKIAIFEHFSHFHQKMTPLMSFLNKFMSINLTKIFYKLLEKNFLNTLPKIWLMTLICPPK